MIYRSRFTCSHANPNYPRCFRTVMLTYNEDGKAMVEIARMGWLVFPSTYTTICDVCLSRPGNYTHTRPKDAFNPKPTCLVTRRECAEEFCFGPNAKYGGCKVAADNLHYRPVSSKKEANRVYAVRVGTVQLGNGSYQRQAAIDSLPLGWSVRSHTVYEGRREFCEIALAVCKALGYVDVTSG